MLRVNSLVGFGRSAAAQALPFGLYLLGYASGSSGATTLALTTTRAAPAGSTIVVLSGFGAGGGVTSIADGGNSYSLVYSGFAQLFHAQNVALAAGATITGTYSASSTDRAMIAAYISGAAAASADVHSGKNATLGGMNSDNTATLAQAAEIYVGGVIHLAANAFAEDSNYDTLQTVEVGVVRLNMASRIVASTSGRNYKPSQSPGGTYTSIASVYKKAA